jgi:uncharacterized membrane protein
MTKPWFDDDRLESVMGNLLRIGVLVAAAVVAAGGIFYLVQHHSDQVNYSQFQSEPSALKTIPGIVHEAAGLRSTGIMQLGLLLLIATPILRVVCAVFGFALERDFLYTIVSLIVLGVLLYSLFGHAM